MLLIVERRQDVDRRSSEDRRQENDPSSGENGRNGDDRRRIERRIQCQHCGEKYRHRTSGQRFCDCRTRAFQNPGYG